MSGDDVGDMRWQAAADRVGDEKVCELEDREVSQGEIGKGYEYAKGQIVPISDAELKELPLPTAKTPHVVMPSGRPAVRAGVFAQS